MTSPESAQQQSQQLVEEYLSYAEALAWSLRGELPPHVEMEEVLSLARLGLVDAAQKFDPNRRVCFKTYAYYRIRGAIYDGIRAQGLPTRRDVERYKFRKAMDLYLQQELASRPAEAPSPRTFGLPEFKQIVGVMTSVYLLSLDSGAVNTEFPAPGGTTPQQELEQNESIQRVRELLSGLPEQERVIMRMYYYEDRTLDEIGQVLDLSRSWVCRIHNRILKKLHTQFVLTERAGRTSLRI